MYLISVYFDEQANKNLQRYINMIADKTGNTFMTDNNVPPHMTISSIEARNVDVIVPAFEALKDNINAGSIQFVSVGQLLLFVMRNNFAPFDANVTGIGLAKVNPHEDVIRYELM